MKCNDINRYSLILHTGPLTQNRCHHLQHPAVIYFKTVLDTMIIPCYLANMLMEMLNNKVVLDKHPVGASEAGKMTADTLKMGIGRHFWFYWKLALSLAVLMNPLWQKHYTHTWIKAKVFYFWMHYYLKKNFYCYARNVHQQSKEKSNTSIVMKPQDSLHINLTTNTQSKQNYVGRRLRESGGWLLAVLWPFH